MSTNEKTPLSHKRNRVMARMMLMTICAKLIRTIENSVVPPCCIACCVLYLFRLQLPLHYMLNPTSACGPQFAKSRGIMSRASTDFWSDFRGRIYLRGFRGRTFFRWKHVSVRTSTDFFGLCGLGEGITDLTGVVRTW